MPHLWEFVVGEEDNRAAQNLRTLCALPRRFFLAENEWECDGDGWFLFFTSLLTQTLLPFTTISRSFPIDMPRGLLLH